MFGVCLIHAFHQNAIHYLVVKRPPTGLLAGQWEFPSIKVCGTDEHMNQYVQVTTRAQLTDKDTTEIPPYEDRKRACTIALGTKYGSTFVDQLENATLTERRDLGQLIHVFSHIKHHLGIEQIDTQWVDIPSHLGAWMTLDELNRHGLTTGMKKVLKKT